MYFIGKDINLVEGDLCVPSSTRSRIRLPKCLLRRQYVIHPTAPDEQRVAQPVEIRDCIGWHSINLRQRHRKALGTAAYSAAHV